MTAYYNEFDPFAAAWLRELIKAGHIAPGEVDERSIEDVQPDDLAGFTQCHFFAGIGVWSYALRLAGCPDDRPIWTGSCPCQPFSSAGKGNGFADERHLWPAFFHLICQCNPLTVCGEQVASKDGLAWFDLVSADLEGTGYACGAIDTCAAGFGAPHIRQRLYWVANDQGRRWREEQPNPGRLRKRAATPEYETRGSGTGFGSGRLGIPIRQGLEGFSGNGCNSYEPGRYKANEAGSTSPASKPCRMGNSFGELPGPVNGLWRDADWLFCRDARWRPVRPGSFPLVNGATNRVGRLRGYGNAINASQAAEFIRAYMEIKEQPRR